MTCFQLANPAGLVSKYRLGNECEVWSETHFTMVTYAGDDGVGRDRALHADRLHPDDLHRLLAERRRHLAGQIRRPSTGATVVLPQSLRRHQGDPLARSAGRPGRAPATTSANPSTSATSSTGTRPAWARESRTSTSARTCGSATALSPSTASPGRRRIAPRRRCRRRSTSAFETICSFAGSSPWESGEFQLGFQYIANYSNQMPDADRTAGGASPSSSCRRCSAATTSSPSSTAGAAERALERSRASTTRTSRSLTTRASPGSGSSTCSPFSPSTGSARRLAVVYQHDDNFSATPG